MNKDIVREYGRELYEKDGMRDMVRCHNLLDEIIHYNYNKGDNKENYDLNPNPHNKRTPLKTFKDITP